MFPLFLVFPGGGRVEWAARLPFLPRTPAVPRPAAVPARRPFGLLPLVAAGVFAFAAAGCETKENVLDVDGPGGGGLEIDKTTDMTGDEGVEIDME